MVNLGDEVKDTISGFKGTAICRHIYIQGCNRITVQTKITKEQREPIELSFDEPQLEVTKAVKIPKPIALKRRGGPERHMPQKKITG